MCPSVISSLETCLPYKLQTLVYIFTIFSTNIKALSCKCCMWFYKNSDSFLISMRDWESGVITVGMGSGRAVVGDMFLFQKQTSS